MSYRLEIVIPGLTPMNTSATRRHWAVQHREAKEIKELVTALVGRRRPDRPLMNARVTCRRFSTREPDAENLALGFKAAIDGLVECGVLLSDAPTFLERRYEWGYAPRGKGSLAIVVEGL